MNAAREFEFLFVIDGVSVDDDQATAVLIHGIAKVV